ncbi:hypothetical protein RV15_GL003212 [Enterococcus silesiacus]|uniref:Uncharacterized protein n=1 Tax=Enterococcus silesiacus TaxID=332949 RepID=A0AA91JQ55_9ENTE|nr:hypothetical protein RV15_GL003212 [Enterococcus silesiacus]
MLIAYAFLSVITKDKAFTFGQTIFASIKMCLGSPSVYF